MNHLLSLTIHSLSMQIIVTLLQLAYCFLEILQKLLLACSFLCC